MAPTPGYKREYSTFVHMIDNTVFTLFNSALLSADDYPDVDCRPTHNRTEEDPVLLFDLDQDIGESSTLTDADPVYSTTLSEMLTVSQYAVSGVYLG